MKDATHYLIKNETTSYYKVELGKTYLYNNGTWEEISMIESYKILHELIKL